MIFPLFIVFYTKLVILVANKSNNENLQAIALRISAISVRGSKCTRESLLP